MTKKEQSLLSAAVYHFGSYRTALEKAGINYGQVIQRPRWNKPRIIAMIKKARRDGEDLHWGAVSRRRDDLGRAAFAALQPRLFGRWDRALAAAGLDADEIARYRSWDRNTVVFELRARAQNDEPLNSGAVQKDDPGLHAAAVRYFGTFDKALQGAKFDPNTHRQRRSWSKERVLKELKQMARKNGKLTDPILRKSDAGLYGAAIRLFGSFTKARRAAGIKPK